MLRPSLEEFRQLAHRGNLIPVAAEIVSDVETPVGAFQKIGRDGFSLLFESAERNEESGRFSFIGINPLLIVSHRGGDITVREKSGPATTRSTSDPLGELQKINIVLHNLSALSRLQPIAAPTAGDRPDWTVCESNTSDFEKMVLRAKEYIAEGDIFQVVLSQRFESEFLADPLDLYRCLRFGNPSPYMFLLNFGDEFCALGSSPELHVRVRGRTAELRPIAGTRPRGADSLSDEANARELLADPKERAEHVMLIDLARNDLGRIAQIGSVRVTEQMTIERYSHVMHIVSHVEARLRDGLTAFGAFRATFPAGTVSGTPKIRPMQISAELEKVRRGLCAGAVGWCGLDRAGEC